MRTTADKVDHVVLDLVDQQKVTANVTFPVVGPIALERVIQPFRAERCVVGNQQQHRCFEPFHVVAPGTSTSAVRQNPARRQDVWRVCWVDYRPRQSPERMWVSHASRQLGVSRVQFSRFINGRAGVTPDLAIRLSKWIPAPTAIMWLQMQADYDLWQAERSGRELQVEPAHGVPA